jgi:hypothetical protein
MCILLIAHRNMVVLDGDLGVYLLVSVETYSNSGVTGNCLFAVLLRNFVRKIKSLCTT